MRNLVFLVFLIASKSFAEISTPRPTKTETSLDEGKSTYSFFTDKKNLLT